MRSHTLFALILAAYVGASAVSAAETLQFRYAPGAVQAFAGWMTEKNTTNRDDGKPGTRKRIHSYTETVKDVTPDGATVATEETYFWEENRDKPRWHNTDAYTAVRTTRGVQTHIDIEEFGGAAGEQPAPESIYVSLDGRTLVLPDHPVNVGDTWTFAGDTEVVAGSMGLCLPGKYRIVYTLAAVDEKDGRKYATIRAESVITYVRKGKPLYTITSTGKTTFRFDIAAEELVGFSYTRTSRTDTDIPDKGTKTGFSWWQARYDGEFQRVPAPAAGPAAVNR